MNNDAMIRGSKEFQKMLKEIKIERIKKDKDKKMLSDRRLSLAMTRIPKLKEILVNSDIREDEKKKEIKRQLDKEIIG